MIGKAVFSETAVTIFLTFCMKLGDYKGRKVTEQDFWKKLLIWRYSWKRFQISQKSDTLIFFSKMALTIFLVFSLKLVLNMAFNLNETHFSEKFAIWRYLTSKSPKICPNWGFHNVVARSKMRVVPTSVFDVDKTLLQCRYNIKHCISRPLYYGLFWYFFPSSKSERVTKLLSGIKHTSSLFKRTLYL